MSRLTADDLFRWWILQQQTAVMMHLGKIAHPVTQQVERDLETARLLIDLMAAMETKTKGNLSAEDERLLGSILTNLRLNFVQEANRPDPADAGAAGQAEEEAPGVEGEESSRAEGAEGAAAGEGPPEAAKGDAGASEPRS